MEVALVLRKDKYGKEHEELFKAVEVFALSCNALAVELLFADDFEPAYRLLKKCEVLTMPDGYVRHELLRMKLAASYEVAAQHIAALRTLREPEI